MALSYVDYPGNSSTTTWAVPFQFLTRDDISVVDVSDESPISFTWLSDSQISISPAVATGTTFRIKRTTDTTTRAVDFQDATVLGESDLDYSADQNFFIAQEVFDTVADKLGLAVDNTYDANSKRISNVTDPVNAQDVATKNWSETALSSSVAQAATSASNAATSESNAAASESAAATSEFNAATSESNAATSEFNAATSESNAAASESAAATSESNANADAIATAADRVQTGLDAASTAADVIAAAALLDQFDDRYLGSKTSNPTLDNDGNALVDGALYFNTTSNVMYVYDLGTTTWIALPVSSIASLTDVSLTSVATGEALLWNGTDWVNERHSRKNFIINGVAPFVNQEGDKTEAVNGGYIADIWKTELGIDGVVNAAVVSDYIELDVTTADTSITAGQFAFLSYAIEGFDASPLKLGTASAKTVTLSFKHKHTKTGTYCVALRNSAFNRSYVFEYTQVASNTEETHSEVINLDTAGTWLTDTSIGLQVNFAAAIGSTYQTIADAWQTGNFIATSNQVNALDSVSNFFRITDVQLEIGSVATEPEIIPYADKLAQVQRYYEKSYNYNDVAGTATFSGREILSLNGSGLGFSSWLFLVMKRVAPSFTYYDTAGNASRVTKAGVANATVTAGSIANNGEHGLYIDASISGGGANDKIEFHWTADARL